MFGLRPYTRRLMENIMESPFNDFWLEELRPLSRGRMRVNIKEDGEKYLLEAELPGLNKEEIILKADDDVLTIAVKRDERIEKKDENYIMRERRYGSMSRSFYFNDVDLEKIKAKFENGILYVTLPKLEGKKDRGRTINIE
ncbi:MAG: Hsp20/alpha crystallin family protein [Tissierellia bacterium]|nr:Hsp20/alpha crystallin family protein [Tissierellia bacterium]